MVYSTEQSKRILEFREKKSKELKRLISYSEAVALWISESFLLKPTTDPENTLTH